MTTNPRRALNHLECCCCTSSCRWFFSLFQFFPLTSKSPFRCLWFASKLRLAKLENACSITPTMSQPSTTPDFAPSCHSDGTWYACGTGFQFVGCCNTGKNHHTPSASILLTIFVDPCNDIGCPTGDLMPASFNPAAYGHFSDQQCSAGSVSPTPSERLEEKV